MKNNENDLEKIKQSFFLEIENSKFKFEYPITYRELVRLKRGIFNLTNGILISAENGNLYCSKALSRILIEHYVRFVFLIFKWSATKHDEPAKNYYIFSNVNNTSYELNDEKSKMRDDYGSGKIRSLKMNKQHSYYADNKKTEISRYTFKAIVSYIISYTESHSSEKNIFFHSVINKYSELSSYIHGGEIDEQLFISKPLLEKELSKLIDFASNIESISNKYLLNAIKKTDSEIYSKFERYLN